MGDTKGDGHPHSLFPFDPRRKSIFFSFSFHLGKVERKVGWLEEEEEE